MRDFTKYDVWNSSIEFSLEVYNATSNFPGSEKFGLTNQLRRASISIPSNFAEGCSRSSEKDFKRFIELSLGSAFELKTQCILSNRLGYIQNDVFNDLVEKLDVISKQLNSLRNKLN